MPTKPKRKPAEPQSKGIFGTLMDSGHQVFLAGLGAAARVATQGPRMFESLVQEGAQVESRNKQQFDARVEEARESPFYSWENMEAFFDEQIARSLNRLGLASQHDIQAIHRQLDELDQEINKLPAAKTPKPRVHPRRVEPSRTEAPPLSEEPPAGGRPEGDALP